MKRYCLCLDLKDDPKLIAEYEAWHRNVWPEVIASIREAGINQMSIYRIHTRLIMVAETEDSFSFEKKAAMDAGNVRVQEWEELMWKYQEPLPWAKAGEKWIPADEIFSLDSY